jgi:hypothetical protein
MRHLLIAATIALGAAVTPAAASESFSGAAALDKVEATYVRHNREHRMWEIQRNLERQQRYGYRDRGYGRGYGYGYRDRGYDRGYGYGYGRRDYDRYDRF